MGDRECWCYCSGRASFSSSLNKTTHYKGKNWSRTLSLSSAPFGTRVCGTDRPPPSVLPFYPSCQGCSSPPVPFSLFSLFSRTEIVRVCSHPVAYPPISYLQSRGTLCLCSPSYLQTTSSVRCVLWTLDYLTPPCFSRKAVGWGGRSLSTFFLIYSLLSSSSLQLTKSKVYT